jgi:hypothetical protein
VKVNNLTDSDYDALYVAVREQMPRIPRELFPLILEQGRRVGELQITITDTEITITNTVAPELGVYTVARKRSLH